MLHVVNPFTAKASEISGLKDAWPCLQTVYFSGPYSTSVSTPLRWIGQKRTIIFFYKQSVHSCKITCERSESARERRIALYKSDQQQQHLISMLSTSTFNAMPRFDENPSRASVKKKSNRLKGFRSQKGLRVSEVKKGLRISEVKQA